MPRYILVDSVSGHVFADSADFAGGAKFDSPMQFAKAFDASTKELGRKYEWLREAPAGGGLGYHVYRPHPSVDLPIVEDGTAAEELAAIKRDSTYVGFVRCLPGKPQARAA